MLRSSCLGMQEGYESLERFDAAAKLAEIVGAALADNESRAVRTDEQREGASPLPLGLLVRAHTGVLLKRALEVRNLSHSDGGEPNA